MKPSPWPLSVASVLLGCLITAAVIPPFLAVQLWKRFRRCQ